jgi:hypothetical protein
MYEHMIDDMDISAGVILAGTPLEEVGRQIFEEILAVASGQETKSEINGVGEEEFAPCSIGPPLRGWLSPARRQALWRQLLLTGDEREDELRRAEWVVGDEHFPGGMAERRGRLIGCKRGRRPGAMGIVSPGALAG